MVLSIAAGCCDLTKPGGEGGGGGVITYNSLYGKAPPKRGTSGI